MRVHQSFPIHDHRRQRAEQPIREMVYAMTVKMAGTNGKLIAKVAKGAWQPSREGGGKEAARWPRRKVFLDNLLHPRPSPASKSANPRTPLATLT
jgi:hypothetical protein